MAEYEFTDPAWLDAAKEIASDDAEWLCLCCDDSSCSACRAKEWTVREGKKLLAQLEAAEAEIRRLRGEAAERVE